MKKNRLLKSISRIFFLISIFAILITKVQINHLNASNVYNYSKFVSGDLQSNTNEKGSITQIQKSSESTSASIQIYASPSGMDGSSFGTDNGYIINEDGGKINVYFNKSNLNQTLPYYFRIRGAKNKTVTFNWQYIGDESKENVMVDRPMVVFYPDSLTDDRIAYEKGNTGYFYVKGMLSFTHTFKKDEAYVCYTPTHTNTQVATLINKIKNNPNVSLQFLGNSRFYQYPLNVIKITDPQGDPLTKKGILFLGKEDAYEAGSLSTMGITRFLLSDDPLAVEMRQRFIFYIIPVVSLDGNHIGSTNYILNSSGSSYIYFTEQWNKPAGAYPEADWIKNAITEWKRQGLDISIFNSFHSESYFQSFARMQYCDDAVLRDNFYKNILIGKYWKDFVIANGGQVDLNENKVQFFIHSLYPNAITGSSHTDFLIKSSYYGTSKTLFKTNDDIYQDGELYLRAVANLYGLQNADNSKPLLYCGNVEKDTVGSVINVTYKIIYRDLLNRAPSEVKVVVDGVSYTMQKDASTNYSKGVFYTFSMPLNADVEGYYFEATNASGTKRVPEIAQYPGPVKYISAAVKDLKSEDSENFQLFPNPTSGNSLNIVLKNMAEKENVQFFNAVGVLVKEVSLKSSSSINISDLQNGVYFVRLSNNPSITKKIIKN
jgi:hypothetical protein